MSVVVSPVKKHKKNLVLFRDKILFVNLFFISRRAEYVRKYAEDSSI